MQPGKIIILNGTSCSGKTTLAHALQNALSEPYYALSIDDFQNGFPAGTIQFGDGIDPAEVPGWLAVVADGRLVDLRMGPQGLRFLEGLYASLAAFAAAGNNIIFEDVFYDERALKAALKALQGLPVLLVGVFVPLEVARQREEARGTALPGGAEVYFERVHAHELYDLEVDTAMATPDECALAIRDFLDQDLPLTATRRLARRMGVA